MIENLAVACIALLLASLLIYIYRDNDKNLSRLLGMAVIYHLIYVIFLFLPIEFPAISIDNSAMNWVGKVLAIGLSVIAIISLQKYFEINYITNRPAAGSLKKVITVGVIVLVVMCLLTVAFSKAKPVDYEKLAFQLTMPGIDEEIWRGILLALLVPIVGVRKFKMGHPAVWAITLIFALAHSFYFQNWEPGFAVDAFIITGGLGYMLGWMTYYSRSILPALIFHNLINFSTNFIEMYLL